MSTRKPLAIAVVVLGARHCGAGVATAGWGWNAKVDVEGTTISTSWSVAQGGKAQYDAAITIAAPAKADVNIIEVAGNETVTVVRTRGRCSNGTIDAVVTYLITGNGHGDDVSVSVDQVGGDGESFGSGTGKVGSPISVNVSIPGDCKR